MTQKDTARPIHWVGSSLDDLRSFPAEVQDVMGYAIYLAQCGERHRAAKPMRGALYVLHAFQKKAKQGVATPRNELALIRRRYRVAQEHHLSEGG